MITFNFKGNSYKAPVDYKQYTIDGICDTGATVTAIDIYSLSALTGFSGKSIYNYAVSRINNGMNCGYASTASGKLDRTVCIKLKNVSLDGNCITDFYMKLNIDNDLWKTDGAIIINGEEKVASPYILIGLDIIRAYDIVGDKDKIELRNFNSNLYASYCSEHYTDTINLYESIENIMLAEYIQDILN